MMLKFTNTLTGKKEEFRPIKDKTVGMYNCGPTVYNYAHLGNLRAFLLADLIKRTLLFEGFSVNQVLNITDVGHLVGDGDEGEDKVEKAASSSKKTVKEITEFYTNAFFDDIEKLNIDIHDTKFPKATDHIDEQIALIKTLEEKGYTYKISDGIYFDTSKFSDYGKLGNINLAGLEEGSRVEKNPEKKNATDFALWKFSDKRRQQEWGSPWGVGFPGWHLECSAMSMKYLGESFDIHTGGIDHIPVHHNNEIAQSECATGKKYARFWLHNAFVNVSSDPMSHSAGASPNSNTAGASKMAKSDGNFLRLQSLLDKGIDPLAYRYWLLTAHYSTPVMFSFESVSAAETALHKLKKTIAKYEDEKVDADQGYINKFTEAIENDLDTPIAIAILWELIKDDEVKSSVKKVTIKEFDKVLGLELFELPMSRAVPVPQEIHDLVAQREMARKLQNWQKADEIRQELIKLGYNVKDTEKGPEIEVVE